MNHTQIGLPKEHSEKTVQLLNVLLADFQLHYQNLRGLHWNLRGRDFFELHVKFEEFYMDAQVKIDMIAERILTMGFKPLHTFSGYLKHAKIKPAENISDGKVGVSTVVAGLQTLLETERELLILAAEVKDDGTADMMTQFISQQEKEIWMLNAWLG